MSMVFFCSKTEVKKEVADPGYPDKEQVSDPGHSNKEEVQDPGHTDPDHTDDEEDTDPDYSGREDYSDEEEGPDTGDTESVDESAFQVFLLLAHNTAY